MKKSLVIIFIACICFFSISSSAYSAVDVLLYLTGIQGESVVQDHEGKIDVLAWSWDISSESSMHVVGGAGTSKAIVGPLTVTKYIDKASAHLILNNLNGSMIPEAILVVRKAGEDALDYLKITMSNVRVISVSNGGVGGNDRLTESVTLEFLKVCYAYTPQKEDGTGDAEIEACWDIEKNMEE